MSTDSTPEQILKDIAKENEKITEYFKKIAEAEKRKSELLDKYADLFKRNTGKVQKLTQQLNQAKKLANQIIKL